MNCNICGGFEFISYKDVINERCKQCKSLGRHRRFCDIMLEEMDGGEKCLCIATPNYNKILNQFDCNVTNINIYQQTNSTQIMDVTEMKFENEFDLILCEAVLEHIPDEEKALENIYNALDYGGKLIIYVPFTHDLETDETPYEYTVEHKGKTTDGLHLRKHGYSFVKKLRNIGFDVKIKRRHFICRK